MTSYSCMRSTAVLPVSELAFKGDKRRRAGSGRLRLLAGLVLGRVFYTMMPITLDLQGLAWVGVPGGAAIMVLLEVLLIGSLGVPGTAWTSLREINAAWDWQPGTSVEVQVVGKNTVRARASTYHYLTLADWRHAGVLREVVVPGWFYHDASTNRPVTVTQRPVVLGVAWVASLESAHWKLE